MCRCQVIAGPLDKLTPKANAKLSDIGTPEQLIYSVGPYITGFDPPQATFHGGGLVELRG